MQIKPGVYGFVHIDMVPVAAEYENWRRSHGYAEGTITSCMDGKHSSRSWHYEGRALDFRTNDMKEEDVEMMTSWLKSILGTDYDVILHSTHLHVEFEGRIEV